MTKLHYKFTIGQIYYTIFNNIVYRTKLITVKLDLKHEPVYNNKILESNIFSTEARARRYILKKFAKTIKLIDNTQ